MRPGLMLLLTIAMAPPLGAAEKDRILAPGKRILILGDSNTYAGHYIVFLEAALRQQLPKGKVELINLGLPSETASGLSEPEHPFPRPDVHERLDRALKKIQPEVVFACYGMNDGIYYPLSDQRFQAYQNGIHRLVQKAQKAGAKVVLLTPPPFDPVPVKKKNKLKPAGSEKYAWFAPYEKYDVVLARYAKWIMQQKDKVAKVIDIHTPTLKHLEAKRRNNPDYALTGDGVHPNTVGHEIIANAILKAFGYKPVDRAQTKLIQKVRVKQFLLRDAWLTHVGHKRPGVKKGMPLEEAQKKAIELEEEIRELSH